MTLPKNEILGIIRHGLTIAGGYLIANGLVAEGESAEIIGSIMSLIGIVWSVLDKKNK